MSKVLLSTFNCKKTPNMASNSREGVRPRVPLISELFSFHFAYTSVPLTNHPSLTIQSSFTSLSPSFPTSNGHRILLFLPARPSPQDSTPSVFAPAAHDLRGLLTCLPNKDSSFLRDPGIPTTGSHSKGLPLDITHKPALFSLIF